MLTLRLDAWSIGKCCVLIWLSAWKDTDLLLLLVLAVLVALVLVLRAVLSFFWCVCGTGLRNEPAA